MTNIYNKQPLFTITESPVATATTVLPICLKTKKQSQKHQRWMIGPSHIYRETEASTYLTRYRPFAAPHQVSE